MELGKNVGSELMTLLGIDDGLAIGTELSTTLGSSLGVCDKMSGTEEGFVGTVVGIKIGSSPSIFASPVSRVADGCGDGIDDALVGSNVGSDDGVADGSFVTMVFPTKVGSSDGEPLADGSGVDASNTSVGLGVKYKLVLVGSSDIAGT